MKKTGIIGWRSMVGSILLKRMEEEKDFDNIETHFFSSSQVGEELPEQIKKFAPHQEKFLDAKKIEELEKMDILMTCQGSAFTKKYHSELREKKWDGYWIDAASHLRMKKESTIVLDPVNKELIVKNLESEKKDFCGGNCTTAILLMGISGLLKKNLVESISIMTYQAASGAGSSYVEGFLEGVLDLAKKYDSLKNDLEKNELIKDFNDYSKDKLREKIEKLNKEKKISGATLAMNLFPWIDEEVKDGHDQSKEEKKTMDEVNKILGTTDPINIDGICVRVPIMQCHSEALVIKLKEDISVDEAKKIITDKEISESNAYVKIIKNNKEETIKKLNPIAVMNTLNIHVGRIRKMKTDPLTLYAFVIGDQLLWGAAEPLRRILRIIIDFKKN